MKNREYRRRAGILALLLLTAAVLLCACQSEKTEPVNAEATETTAEPTTAEPTTEAPLAAVRINEYATSKTQTLLSDSGEFVSWVELYNPADDPVSLEGFALSDKQSKKTKWRFPQVTLEAKSFLVVYLSGEERAFDGAGELHADFKLNGKEDGLFLFDENGRTVDSCKVYDLFSNLTCGRAKDESFAFFSVPTPGKKNTGTPFYSVDSAALAGNKDLVISEVAPVNTSASSPGGVTSDYIELYNASGSALSLADYKLSDSKNAERFLSLPKKTLAAGEYAVVWCTEEKNAGGITLDLGLKRFGETVYLMKNGGAVVDSLRYGRLSDGYCCGRDLHGEGEAVYFDRLTPGKANPERLLSAMLPDPAVSRDSGYVKSGTKIEIVSDAPVYYTLDGSVPTKESAPYSGEITVNKTTTLRARAIAPGAVPSEVVTKTYLVEKKHDLPVVCLSTDADGLFSEQRGILATGSGASPEFHHGGENYWQGWEGPIHFEYMNAAGAPQVAFDGGVQVFGQFSRALEQKSLAIYLRDKYGPGEVCCPFFPNGAVNVFSSLVLRNSGQDFSSAHLRDAFCAMVMKGQVDVDFMDYRPVAVYINGDYFGLYDLREKINGDYLENHRGIDKHNTDLIKGNRIVQLGSLDDHTALLNYVKTHDLRDDAVYRRVCKWVDIDNLIEYWMCESFFCNTDTGNIRFYREKTDGAKWRWIFFDVDWALFPSTYKVNSIQRYLNPKGHGVNNGFHTTLMVNLMKNPAFRARVLKLHKKHLATTFDKDRMLKIFDRMVEEIEPEMHRHTARWKSISYEKWQSSVKQLRSIVEQMTALFKEKMKTGFSMTKAEIEAYL